MANWISKDSQTDSEKGSNGGELALLDIKIYWKDMGIKTC